MLVLGGSLPLTAPLAEESVQLRVAKAEEAPSEQIVEVAGSSRRSDFSSNSFRNAKPPRPLPKLELPLALAEQSRSVQPRPRLQEHKAWQRGWLPRLFRHH